MKVLCRGDMVKDGSGSSASQMTAAKVMDIMSRLPGCAGQAADAVSAYTQVKMEDAPTLLKISKSECPDILIRLPKHKMTKIMVQYGRPSCSSCPESVRSSSGRAVVGKAIRECSIGTRLEKVLNWECLFVNRARGLTVLVDVCGDIELAGRTENTKPTWKTRKKDVDLEEPTSFLGLYSKRMYNEQ